MSFKGLPLCSRSKQDLAPTHRPGLCSPAKLHELLFMHEHGIYISLMENVDRLHVPGCVCVYIYIIESSVWAQDSSCGLFIMYLTNIWKALVQCWK